jgi:hypothetical protein
MRRLIIFFAMAVSAVRAVDLQQGLALYYSFDHVADATVPDEGSSHGNGKIINATPESGGVRGGCLHFTGDHSYIEVDRNPTTSPKHTVSLWFKADPAGLTNVNGQNFLGMNRRYGIHLATNGPHFRLDSTCLNGSPYGYGAFNARSSIFDVIPGKWYHVVMIADGGAGFYVNGRSLGYTSGPGVNAGNLKMTIGAVQNDPSIEPHLGFAGYLDEVRIYDRVLTDDEIVALFRKDAPQELLPAAPVALGPSYVVKNGRFFLRTEKDGAVSERELTEQELADLLHKVPPGAGTEKDTAEICEIGFSNDARGEQDVTFFLPGETLHVRVRDVDLPSANTNLSVQVFLSQTNAQTSASVPRALKQLDRARDGSFKTAIPLADFHPGPLWISVVAADGTGQPMLMRSSRLEILDRPAATAK